MDKVRYAIVGAGWISQEAFMPAVAASGNSRMTAIVTGNAEVREKLADFYRIETTCDYDGYDALLADDVVTRSMWHCQTRNTPILRSAR